MKFACSNIAVVALSLVLSVPNAHALQYEVSYDLESGGSEASGVQSTQGTGAASWTFSSSNPVFTMISIDDQIIPVQVHTSEYVLSDPKKGVFKFRDGKVSSATRTPLDVITTPTLSVRSVRPTLFVSIPGATTANANGHGIWDWQKDKLDVELAKLINQSQYMHFTVDWESNLHMQSQVGSLADLIKEFLNAKAYAWDVVLIGHSRGGIFAHEVGERLAGHAKISKLHLVLLDPTAATSLGDTYPSQKPAGSFGYLKYDSFPFSWLGSIGTRGDENISGYNNYGQNDFSLVYRDLTQSHGRYPADWIADTGTHGLAALLASVTSNKDNSGASFAVDAASGKDLVQIRTREIDADLDATCTTTSCTLDGQVAFGPLGTVTMTGTIGSDGIDTAIATTLGGASVVTRQDLIYATQTTLFSEHSARIEPTSITVQAQIANGHGTVVNELGLTGAEVMVSVGNINIPVISIGPLDALIPGASLFKKKWKVFKGLF